MAVLSTIKREASMTEVSTIGLDLAKMVFQAHGADASGGVVFRKTLRRAKVLDFFREQPRCLVAMEACGGAHYWAREFARLGHDVRLIPPAYVKPFVKRQKNDASDAEAICEAAQRPTMRFVAVKSEAAQASAAIFRTRDLLVRQRTQLINAVRGQMTEHGLVAAKGPANLPKLLVLVEEAESILPQAARAMLDVLVDMVMTLAARITELDREIEEEDVPTRLMTIPGIGPITATAIAAIAPPIETFRKGRDFAAWLGLTPVQHSTGGKQKLGATSKMGERTIRRLLIIGAAALVRQTTRRAPPTGSWLARMLARKPRMLVITALANKMARTVWALLAHNDVYRAPALAAA
jgi:transposase